MSMGDAGLNPAIGTQLLYCICKFNSPLKSAMEKGIINHQVIALGGIDSSNIHQLATMGFGGAAVLGVIWNHTELTSIRKELNLLMKFAN